MFNSIYSKFGPDCRNKPAVQSRIGSVFLHLFYATMGSPRKNFYHQIIIPDVAVGALVDEIDQACLKINKCGGNGKDHDEL
jgi:hypothetical protein